MSFDMFAGVVAGKKALFVVPTIPDDAPAAVREGLARRRIAILTGDCPCGGVTHAEFQHEADCPAADEALRKFGWISLFGGESR